MKLAPRSSKLGIRGLALALYFMVAGGPFGLEELIAKVGFKGALLVLAVTPILWSLPTALMVGELGSALPEEGGFYAWVKRALGPFWGFQEAWLSLAASVVDMAIYPTLFVAYLGRLVPWVADHGVLTSVAFIGVCLVWNLRGAGAVGRGATALAVVLLAPFLALALTNLWQAPLSRAPSPATLRDPLGAMLIALWNYMGWDNASTVAPEVNAPQRTYPRAVGVSLALVALTYLLPVAAAGATGVDPSAWTSGSWVDFAGETAGPVVAKALVVAGAVSPLGMFGALMMSYSRLPMALADDGLLHPAFGKRLGKTQVPWVSLVACAGLWMASLGLSFERLVAVDILLYGVSLLLEFAALVWLRVRAPALPRPYKIPGGLGVVALLGVGPLLLLGLAFVRNLEETVWGMKSSYFGLLIVAAGPVVYLGARAAWKGPSHHRVDAAANLRYGSGRSRD